MYASQKVVSSLRRPETHFKHAQGHFRANALTGSINIIQNTIITVYEVESLKTVHTKLWKRINWFSEVSKKIFQHNFRESQKGRRTNRGSEVGILCYSFAIDTKKILWLKIEGTFREQTRKPVKLTIEKNDVDKKEWQLNNSCRFHPMQIWSGRNKAYSNRKLQK